MGFLKNLKISGPGKERFFALLPIFLIVILILGYLFFTITSLLPQMQIVSEKSSRVAVVKRQLLATQVAVQENPDQLKEEIATAQTRVREEADVFLSQPQAAQALGNVYQYAGESGVKIISLQAQAGPDKEKSKVYDAKTFRLQAEGDIRALMDFVRRIEDVKSFKTYIIHDVKIAEGEGLHALDMNITLYTSPYAPEEARQKPAETVPTPAAMQETQPSNPVPSETVPAPTVLPSKAP